MRIAIDALILGPRDTGVGVFTRDLISALADVDRDNEYVVYHGLDSGPIAGAGAPNVRLACVRIPNHVRLRRIAWEQAVLPVRLARDGIDVLHGPAYIKPLRVRCPAVITVHDVFALTRRPLCKRLNVLHYSLMLPPAVRSARLVHCISNRTRDEVARLWPRSRPRLRVVYPGIADRFRPVTDPAALGRVRARYGITGEPPFLFVGNIEPKKNVVLLLDALKLARERYGLTRKLVIVGQRGWKWRPVIDEFAALHLSDQVVWTGYVPDADLPALYSLAHSLVFPSLCEGFGLPPLEAMRCGTPAIVSDAPAVRETAAPAALVARRTDPADLAEKLHRIATDPALRADLAARGLAHARTFDWHRTARHLIALYHEARLGT